MNLQRTGLPVFALSAVEKEDEKAAFFTFLKNSEISSLELDELVIAKYDEVFGQIDCNTCPNRSHQSQPQLSEEDVAKLAVEFEIPPAVLCETCLRSLEGKPGQYDFKVQPCPFYTTHLCANLDARPQNCPPAKNNEKDSSTPLWEVIFNFELCPTVALAYEELKRELWNPNETAENIFEYD